LVRAYLITKWETIHRIRVFTLSRFFFDSNISAVNVLNGFPRLNIFDAFCFEGLYNLFRPGLRALEANSEKAY